MILQIGDIQFETDMSYEALVREAAWIWEEIPIIGENPVLQFSHKRAPTLNVKGTYWNYAARGNKLSRIETAADTNTPHLLVDDTGVSYGYWVIESLSVQGQYYRHRQETPLTNAWELKLKYYGETLK